MDTFLSIKEVSKSYAFLPEARRRKILIERVFILLEISSFNGVIVSDNNSKVAPSVCFGTKNMIIHIFLNYMIRYTFNVCKQDLLGKSRSDSCSIGVNAGNH